MASAAAKQYASVAAWILCGFLLHSVLHSKYLHSTCYKQEMIQLERLASYIGGYHNDTTSETEKPETTTPETRVAISGSETQQSPESRILCWILTSPDNHVSKARHVKATWGRRCTKLVFMSSKEDGDLGAVALGVGEGRHKLWAKTRAAFVHVYKNHADEADWFLKADDDTYVIMENLRQLLSVHNSSEPHYFGCHLRTFDENNGTFPDNGYMNGGAYVISKAALRKVVEQGLLNGNTCFEGNTDGEDAAFGKCLEHVGVKPDDSRDLEGYTRFVAYQLRLFAQNDTDTNRWWYERFLYDQTNRTKHTCCSKSAVSFHYVGPAQMHLLEYFIYRLKVPWL